MPKQYRIRIRGQQREDIDIDLLAQALLMVAEDLQSDHDDEEQTDQEDDQPEDPS
jgi:hypothetical protein